MSLTNKQAPLSGDAIIYSIMKRHQQGYFCQVAVVSKSGLSSYITCCTNKQQARLSSSIRLPWWGRWRSDRCSRGTALRIWPSSRSCRRAVHLFHNTSERGMHCTHNICKRKRDLQSAELWMSTSWSRGAFRNVRMVKIMASALRSNCQCWHITNYIIYNDI